MTKLLVDVYGKPNTNFANSKTSSLSGQEAHANKGAMFRNNKKNADMATTPVATTVQAISHSGDP